MVKRKSTGTKLLMPLRAPTLSVDGTKSLNKSVFKDLPVYDLLRFFERARDQWTARYILVMTAVVLRAAVGLGGFLGYDTPPMYGDFEAQRHWMEITIHLPINKWYFYDLQYWGLDYPPLTAFHLYIIGQIGNIIDPSWFALDTSRGMETPGIKTFMRISSIVSELILYTPAVLALANKMGKRFNLNRMDQIIVALLIINQAHLVLIDHGHFQFNSIMLGFFLHSMSNLISKKYVIASVWFVCCINFKQMGLYYSTFIFVFILSQLKSLTQLVTVGAAVIGTELLILVPFVMDARRSLPQILVRVFPFSRGLFEDKVANFWCATNIVVKYRSFISAEWMPRLSLAVTVAAIIPVSVVLFFKLRKSQNVIPGLVYGFASHAFAFYLFSFQVHEKSILIPLLPSSLILMIDPSLVDIVQWINNIGTFSMYPLLKRDGLVLQYLVTNALINWLIGPGLLLKRRSWMWDLVIKGSYFAALGCHALDLLIPAPTRYPDLWVILNVSISFASFMIFWIWLNIRAWKWQEMKEKKI